MKPLLASSSALLLSLSLLACAPVAPPLAPSAPIAAAPAAPPDLRWRALRMPQLGVSIEIPGVPEESSSVTSQSSGSWLVRSVALASGPKDQEVNFSFIRMDSPAPDRGEDEALLQRMSATLKSVSSRDPLLVNGFRGIAFEGKSAQGRSVLERVVIAGKTMFLVLVDAPEGAMPRADALRFLDSFRIDPAWSVVPVPALHCTVALPDIALTLRLDTTSARATQFQGFYLGGTGDSLYYVSETSIAASLLASSSVDQILDDSARVLEGIPDNKIHAVTPTALDGVKGRDVRFLSTKLGKEMHLRMFVVGGSLYQVGISASTPELVSDEGALRFLGSLRLPQER